MSEEDSVVVVVESAAVVVVVVVEASVVVVEVLVEAANWMARAIRATTKRYFILEECFELSYQSAKVTLLYESMTSREGFALNDSIILKSN